MCHEFTKNNILSHLLTIKLPYINPSNILQKHDKNIPRNPWHMRRLIILIKRKSDNEIRGASVNVPKTGRTVSISIKLIDWYEQIKDIMEPLQCPHKNAAIIGDWRRLFEKRWTNLIVVQECFIDRN